MESRYWIWLGWMMMGWLISGCDMPPIGEPCTFGWPGQSAEDGQMVTDCTAMPVCHPLHSAQNLARKGELIHDACPADCIQTPDPASDEDMFCVASQVTSGENAFQAVNGQCEAGGHDLACGQTAFTCRGYLTTTCRRQSDCPGGFRCRALEVQVPGLSSKTGLCVKKDWDQEMFPLGYHYEPRCTPW